MKKNGFTLIELLAVIVILAIIALIATPIILGIINDAREESNERSVELYASAVRNGIAAHQLRTGNEVLPGTYNETNKLPFEVDYEGKVECTNVIISESGKVSLEGCTVNGGEKTYNYGIEEETPNDGDIPEVEEPTSTQVYKPQYYYFGYDWSGTVGKTAAPSNPSTVAPTGEIRYLGYDVTDGKVSAAYVCFKRNETEYCLKPNDFAKSTEIIKDAYADVADTDACLFAGSNSWCCAADFCVSTTSFGDGKADVEANVDIECCRINSYGGFNCFED